MKYILVNNEKGKHEYLFHELDIEHSGNSYKIKADIFYHNDESKENTFIFKDFTYKLIPMEYYKKARIVDINEARDILERILKSRIKEFDRKEAFVMSPSQYSLKDSYKKLNNLDTWQLTIKFDELLKDLK